MTPRPLKIPSNNPILARQREHSTCIQPLTTLTYTKTRGRVPKPHQPHQPPQQPVSEIPLPCAHNHIPETRPLIPKLFRRRSGKSASGTSSQTNTSASFEISRDASVEDLRPQQTVLAVPYIDLKVFPSPGAVDRGREADVWVCVEAVVKGAEAGSTSVAAIPSMRFCWKAVGPCEVLEVLGEKSVKELRAGQICQLSLRVRVPRCTDPARRDVRAWSCDDWFGHLEGMLGVHETEVLQIEVKYRYPHVPPDNVMTVKQVCRIPRPLTDCIWSVPGSRCVLEGSEPADAQYRMAPARAMRDVRAVPPSPRRGALSPRPRPPSPHPQQQQQLQQQHQQPRPEVIISHVVDPAPPDDTARQLWRDLQRTSLSSQQLVEMSPQRVEELAASDAGLTARRQQALANKRSVGAETLRQWKWEEGKGRGGGEGEMPWL